jgi:hypothetical protein
VGIPANVVGAGAVALGTGLAAAGSVTILTRALNEPQHPYGNNNGGKASSGGSSASGTSSTLDSQQVKDIVQNETAKGANQREVSSEEDLRNIYDKISTGGKSFIPKKPYDGTMVKLDDGTLIGLREHSSGGKPTVDIFYNNGSYVKIHIQ